MTPTPQQQLKKEGKTQVNGRNTGLTTSQNNPADIEKVPKSPVKITVISSEELAQHNILHITKYKVEKKSNKMDPDTYLAHLS